MLATCPCRCTLNRLLEWSTWFLCCEFRCDLWSSSSMFPFHCLRTRWWRQFHGCLQNAFSNVVTPPM